MIINNPKKGMIFVVCDEFGNQKAISPDELLVITGTVINDENNKKKVGVGTPKKLGVVLSELIDETEKTQKELNELKISYRKTVNVLINICDVLVNQAVINNIDIQDLKANMEE